MASFPIYHPENNWKIYYEAYVDGEKQWSGIYWVSYKRKDSAVRAAKRVFNREEMIMINGQRIEYRWIVSKTPPNQEEVSD